MNSYRMNAFTVDVEDGISLAMRDFFDKTIPQTDQVVRCTHIFDNSFDPEYSARR